MLSLARSGVIDDLFACAILNARDYLYGYVIKGNIMQKPARLTLKQKPLALRDYTGVIWAVRVK